MIISFSLLISDAIGESKHRKHGMSVDESQKEEIAQAGRRYRMDFASYLPPVRAPTGSGPLTSRGRRRKKGKKSGRHSGKNDASKQEAHDFSLSGNNIKLPPIGEYSITTRNVDYPGSCVIHFCITPDIRISSESIRIMIPITIGLNCE